MTAPLDLDAIAPVSLWRYVAPTGSNWTEVCMSPFGDMYRKYAALPDDTLATLVSELRAAREARTKIVSDLYRVLGCVEDLMNCEGWGEADPDSRAGKLNAACAMAEATLSRAATGGNSNG